MKKAQEELVQTEVEGGLGPVWSRWSMTCSHNDVRR